MKKAERNENVFFEPKLQSIATDKVVVVIVVVVFSSGMLK